jgi:hypothetical protein
MLQYLCVVAAIFIGTCCRGTTAEWPCNGDAVYFPDLSLTQPDPGGRSCVVLLGPLSPGFPSLPIRQPFLALARQMCTYTTSGGALLSTASRDATTSGLRAVVAARVVAHSLESSGVQLVLTGAQLTASTTSNGTKVWKWAWPALKSWDTLNLLTVPSSSAINGSALSFGVVLNVSDSSLPLRVLPHAQIVAAVAARKLAIGCQSKAPVPCPRGEVFHNPGPDMLFAGSHPPPPSCLFFLPSSPSLPASPAPPTLKAILRSEADAACAGSGGSGGSGVLQFLPARVLDFGRQGDDMLKRSVAQLLGTKSAKGRWWTAARAMTTAPLTFAWPDGTPVEAALLLPGFGNAVAALQAGAANLSKVAILVNSSLPGLLEVVSNADEVSAGVVCMRPTQLRMAPHFPTVWSRGFLLAFGAAVSPNLGLPVCSVGFGSFSALVACRQMGFDKGIAVFRAVPPNSSDVRAMTGTACGGTESSLSQCPGGNLGVRASFPGSFPTCASPQMVSVECAMADIPSFVP